MTWRTTWERSNCLDRKWDIVYVFVAPLERDQFEKSAYSNRAFRKVNLDEGLWKVQSDLWLVLYYLRFLLLPPLLVSCLGVQGRQLLFGWCKKWAPGCLPPCSKRFIKTAWNVIVASGLAKCFWTCRLEIFARKQVKMYTMSDPLRQHVISICYFYEFVNEKISKSVI